MTDTCSKCTDGWMHYSDGSPMDVCDACFGTGFDTAYQAQEAIAALRDERDRYREALEHIILVGSSHMGVLHTAKQALNPDRSTT